MKYLKLKIKNRSFKKSEYNLNLKLNLNGEKNA